MSRDLCCDFGADELRESWLQNEEQLRLVRDGKLLRFAYLAIPV